MQTDFILKNYGLNENKNLTPYSYENEEDWLELRRKGIGGSDIGAIMGINKYSSPLKIYKAKVEGISEDVSGKVAVRKGKDLESLIRANYVAPKLKDLGYTVRPFNHLLINSKFPWLRANLDGIAINDENPEDFSKHIVIEIKVVTEYAEDNWYTGEYDNVPASYYAQVQEYMAVTETKKALVCALFEKKWEMHYFEVRRNEKFVSELLTVSKKFYDVNMTMGIPPRVLMPIDKDDILEMVKKEPDKTYEDATLTALAMDIKERKIRIKAIEKEVNEMTSELLDRYQKGGRSNSPLVKVSVSVINSKKLNTTRLKEEQPGIYEQYSEDTESFRTNIK